MVVAKVLDIPSTGDCVGVGCSDQGPKGKILLKQLLNFLPGPVFPNGTMAKVDPRAQISQINLPTSIMISESGEFGKCKSAIYVCWTL